VRISYVADETLVLSMNKVRDILSRKIPNARLEQIEAEVYRFYLEAHDREKQKTKPRTTSQLKGKVTRHIPVEVEREVWKRDESRCTFQDENGKRCTCTYALEIDHIVPFCLGGRSDDASNLRLLCRTHNVLEAESKLGRQFMERFRKSDSGLLI
jgi:5-methylcytosine-specific restriction endonuclease McrA